MLTTFTPIHNSDRGGAVVAMAAAPVNSSMESSSRILALESPILIFVFFHKAIRAELDRFHRDSMEFATNQQSGGDIAPLLQRYHFLRALYKHHCNAEDEVFPFLFCSVLLCFSLTNVCLDLLCGHRSRGEGAS